MPGQDQTGPAGMGPMTGRGVGICATGQMNNAGRGRGFGRGMGRGFGYRAAAPAPLTREEQLESLNAQAAGLELQLKTLTEQIEKLKSE